MYESEEMNARTNRILLNNISRQIMYFNPEAITINECVTIHIRIVDRLVHTYPHRLSPTDTHRRRHVIIHRDTNRGIEPILIHLSTPSTAQRFNLAIQTWRINSTPFTLSPLPNFHSLPPKQMSHKRSTSQQASQRWIGNEKRQTKKEENRKEKSF